MDAERREFDATIAAAGGGSPYVNWFEEAKRPATRQRRIEQTVERVRPT